MLTFTIDTTAIDKRLAAMQGKIRHFKSVDLGHELSDWQVQDLHRKKPFTMRSRRAGRAATRIRPHSRYETLHMRRLLRSRIKRMLNIRRWSQRPILRSDLRQRLADRMNEALHSKLHW